MRLTITVTMPGRFQRPVHREVSTELDVTNVAGTYDSLMADVEATLTNQAIIDGSWTTDASLADVLHHLDWSRSDWSAIEPGTMLAGDWHVQVGIPNRGDAVPRRLGGGLADTGESDDEEVVIGEEAEGLTRWKVLLAGAVNWEREAFVWAPSWQDAARVIVEGYADARTSPLPGDISRAMEAQGLDAELDLDRVVVYGTDGEPIGGLKAREKERSKIHDGMNIVPLDDHDGTFVDRMRVIEQAIDPECVVISMFELGDTSRLWAFGRHVDCLSRVFEAVPFEHEGVPALDLGPSDEQDTIFAAIGRSHHVPAFVPALL